MGKVKEVMRSLRAKLGRSGSLVELQSGNEATSSSNEETALSQQDLIDDERYHSNGRLWLGPRASMEVHLAMLSFVKKLPLEQLDAIGHRRQHEGQNRKQRTETKKTTSVVSNKSRTISLGSWSDWLSETVSHESSHHKELGQASLPSQRDTLLDSTISARSGGSFESFMRFLEEIPARRAPDLTREEFDALPDWSDVSDDSDYNEFLFRRPDMWPEAESSETLLYMYNWEQGSGLRRDGSRACATGRHTRIGLAVSLLWRKFQGAAKKVAATLQHSFTTAVRPMCPHNHPRPHTLPAPP